MYNSLFAPSNFSALPSAFGESKVPLYVLNVTYPLVEDEIKRFCAGKRAVLMIEEGPARLHRAKSAVDLAQSGLADQSARQGFAARWRASTPPRRSCEEF